MSFLLGIGEWIYGLLSIVPKLVYFITMSFVTLLDLFQFAVRKLAGLDTYYINGTSEQTGDIALSFIRAIFDESSSMPALRNAFWGLVILGLIMLVLSTIIATIRSEYAGGDNNKNKVISNAVKSMFMFLIVPVSVLFGLMLSDAFLIALDGATSTGGGASVVLVGQVTDKLQSTNVNGQTSYINYDIFSGAIPSNTQTLSGIVFQTAAFGANRVRNKQVVNGKTFYNHLLDGTIGNLGIFQYAQDQETMAKMIDEGFAHNLVFDTAQGVVRLQLGEFGDQAGTGAWASYNNMPVYNLSKFNVGLVWVYYDLWMFNYVIAFAFIFVLIKIMVNIVIGLMKRMVELVALFMISPPIVAIMPIDNGKAFDKWKENFLARALSAIGVILGFNVFFLLMPYIQKLRFLNPAVPGFGFVNMLINTLLLIVALQTIESMIAIISKMVGADDPNKAGGALVEKVGNTVKDAAVLAAGAAGAATRFVGTGAKFAGKAAGAGAKAAGNFAGKGISAVDKKFNNGMLTAKFGQVKEDFGSGLKWASSFGRNKEAVKAKADAEKEWAETADTKYTDRLNADAGYQQDMKNAFETAAKFSGFKGSLEDFMVDTGASATSAREKAEEKYAETNISRADFVSDNYRGSDKDRFVRGKVNEKHNQIYRERKDGAKNTAGKLVRGMGAVGGFVKNKMGGSNISSIYEAVSGNVKSSTVRGGKGGFKAVQNAFKNMSASQVKKKEQADEFKKQEDLKAKASKELDKKG